MHVSPFSSGRLYPSRLGLRGLHLSDNPPPAGGAPPAGGEGTPPGGDTPPQPPAGGENPPAGENPTGQIAFTPEQQAHIQKILSERIGAVKAKAEDEARQKIAAETTKAQQAAERKRQEEQGQWQQVAEGRGKEIEAKDAEILALKPKAERYDAFVASETERINERTKKFHPKIQALDPGSDPARFEERLAWLPKAEDMQKDYDLLTKSYDTDLGRSNGRGGTGNVYDQIRKEQEQKQAAQGGGSLAEKLAAKGVPLSPSSR